MDEVSQYESLFKGRNILFIVPSLAPGGAERVMLTLLKYLSPELKPTLLVLTRSKTELDLVDLGLEIDPVYLGAKRARNALFGLYRFINKLKPDSILCTLGYTNELLSLLIPFLSNDIRFIARESSLAWQRNSVEKHAWFHHYLYSRWMPNFDKIVCQSEEMRNELLLHYRYKPEKLSVIDNPVDVEYIQRKSKEPCKELNTKFHNIIAVGSLKPVKNYEKLITEAAGTTENHRYYIIGEGAERNRLTEQINKLYLQDKVFLLGYQSNPWKFMAKADEFWQKSHWEGNSNALKEWNFLKNLRPSA